MHTLRAFAIGISLVFCLQAAGLDAQHGRAVDVASRARSSERVVVGRVLTSDASQETNDYGDVLIVSHTLVQVEETMKGGSSGTVQVDVEGGTYQGVTMKVSDMPSVQPGERAVFFLARGKSGRYVPSQRGNGVLKLDSQNVVQNSTMTLPQVRASVKEAGQ